LGGTDSLVRLILAIEGLVEGEKLKYLKTAILREAEIRLFNCDLKVIYEKIPN